MSGATPSCSPAKRRPVRAKDAAEGEADSEVATSAGRAAPADRDVASAND